MNMPIGLRIIITSNNITNSLEHENLEQQQKSEMYLTYSPTISKILTCEFENIIVI